MWDNSAVLEKVIPMVAMTEKPKEKLKEKLKERQKKDFLLQKLKRDWNIT